MSETGFFLSAVGICSFVVLSIILIIQKTFSVMMVAKGNETEPLGRSKE